MTTLILLLAQATPPSPGPSGLEGFLKSPLPMVILIVIAFWWIMSRGRRKEQQKFEQMLNNLKRNDRVLTIGGIIGTVVDVREGEIVLKVDESSNVKMRFARSAIKDVLQDTPAESSS